MGMDVVHTCCPDKGKKYGPVWLPELALRIENGIRRILYPAFDVYFGVWISFPLLTPSPPKSRIPNTRFPPLLGFHHLFPSAFSPLLHFTPPHPPPAPPPSHPLLRQNQLRFYKIVWTGATITLEAGHGCDGGVTNVLMMNFWVSEVAGSGVSFSRADIVAE